MSTANCLSCGMPLSAETQRSGTPYCQYCTTDAGELQPFEERFERMTQWTMREDKLDRARAEAQTRDYMRKMPAWKDHPALKN